MTPEQAQALHDERCAADLEHDVCSCWCCCWTCDFVQDAQGVVHDHDHAPGSNCLACYYDEPGQFSDDPQLRWSPGPGVHRNLEPTGPGCFDSKQRFWLRCF